MISPEALRHTADVVERSGVGERLDRRLYLQAKFLERCVTHGWDADEWRALGALMGEG
jgi:hypothetical protein